MYLRSGAPVLNRVATLHHLFLAQIEYYFSLFKKTFLLALSYLISPVPLEPRRRPPGGFGGAGEPPRAPAGSDPGPRAQTGDAGRAWGIWRHGGQTLCRFGSVRDEIRFCTTVCHELQYVPTVRKIVSNTNERCYICYPGFFPSRFLRFLRP